MYVAGAKILEVVALSIACAAASSSIAYTTTKNASARTRELGIWPFRRAASYFMLRFLRRLPPAANCCARSIFCFRLLAPAQLHRSGRGRLSESAPPPPTVGPALPRFISPRPSIFPTTSSFVRIPSFTYAWLLCPFPFFRIHCIISSLSSHAPLPAFPPSPPLLFFSSSALSFPILPGPPCRVDPPTGPPASFSPWPCSSHPMLP